MLEKAVFFGRRARRPISVSAVLSGPSIDLWHSCRFPGCIFCGLWPGCPLDLGSFLLCGIGGHHRRLGHVGWEKCGHGLTSRPRETSDPGFLDSLLQIFGCPLGSCAVLLAGELPLRHSIVKFALRQPCRKLADQGHVHTLLTLGVEGVWKVLGVGSWRGLEEKATHQENPIRHFLQATRGLGACFRVLVLGNFFTPAQQEVEEALQLWGEQRW